MAAYLRSRLREFWRPCQGLLSCLYQHGSRPSSAVASLYRLAQPPTCRDIFVALVRRRSRHLRRLNHPTGPATRDRSCHDAGTATPCPFAWLPCSDTLPFRVGIGRVSPHWLSGAQQNEVLLLLIMVGN